MTHADFHARLQPGCQLGAVLSAVAGLSLGQGRDLSGAVLPLAPRPGGSWHH